MQKNQFYQIPSKLIGTIDEIDKLAASGKSDLTIDFSICSFISVEGLEWLEEMLMRAHSHKAKVSFVNIQPILYKVFKVAKIDSILQACGSPCPTESSSRTC